MKIKHFALLAILLAFGFVHAIAQCVIPISDGQTYTEDFESGTMECWTVEQTGNGTWAVMTGTLSNVAAFQNAASGDEARLISPTFDFSGASGATFSFGYAMMGLYPPYDVLTVSYRSAENDPWHELGNYSLSDWTNIFEETFDLPDTSPTYQISFLVQSNGGYYVFIDNIEITGAGGCARPVNLEVSDLTPFSALLGWSTSGGEESWTIELNGSQSTVDEQPFLMEGLDPGTEYTFRVRANCGGGMASEWSYPASFKTLCDVITVTDDAPYFDDFEGSEEFICWQNDISDGDYGWVIDPGYVIPNNSANFFWLGGEALLYSAPLDITSVTHPTLQFKRKQPLMDDVDHLYVGYRISPDDPWQVIGIYENPANDWEDEMLILPEISATLQVGFDAIASNGNGDGVYIDDVWVGNNSTVGVADDLENSVIQGEALIYDLFGRLVATGQYHDGQVEFERSGLARGVYMARVIVTHRTTTVRFVIE